jgi:hypothetical protein
VERNYAAALERFLEAARLNGAEPAAILHAGDIAGCYLAIGDRSRAEPFARESLAAAARARHRVRAALTIAHLAIVASERDPKEAALLLGYAQARLREDGWELSPPESVLIPSLLADLQRRFSDAELSQLLDEGAAWTDDRALSRALAT